LLNHPDHAEKRPVEPSPDGLSDQSKTKAALPASEEAHPPVAQSFLRSARMFTISCGKLSIQQQKKLQIVTLESP